MGIQLQFGSEPIYSIEGWATKITTRWGTGDSSVNYFDSTFTRAFGGGIPAVGYGGNGTGSGPYSPYTYNGVYSVSLSVQSSVPSTGQSCPDSTFSFRLGVSGTNAVPLISGNTVLCAGDTLNLVAHDTTALFHNLYHNDAIGTTPDWTPISGYGLLIKFRMGLCT